MARGTKRISLPSKDTGSSPSVPRTPKRQRTAPGHTSRLQWYSKNFLQGEIESPFQSKDDEILCQASAEAAASLIFAVGNGLVAGPPRETGLSNMLYALRTSLASIHQEEPEKVPTISLLKRICNPCYDGLDNPNGSAAESILRNLGAINGEEYSLAIVFPIWEMKSLGVVMDARATDNNSAKVVLVYNDNISEVREGSTDRWSGFAPPEALASALESGSTDDSENATDNEVNEESGSEYADEDDSDTDDVDQSSDSDWSAYDGGEVRKKKGSRRANLSSVDAESTYVYRETIPDAPPANSELPFEIMQGITTRELLTFFPNHSLHWPAITARLIAEGWTYAGIAGQINNSRSVSDAPDGEWVKANSLRMSMISGANRFFGRDFRAEHKANRLSGTKRSRVTLPKASRQALETTPWAPASSSSKLHESWNLVQIAHAFRGWPQGIPCEGAFADKVRNAWAAHLQGQTSNPSIVQATLRSRLNPPILPKGWEEDCFVEKSVKPTVATSNDEASTETLLQNHPSHLNGKGKLYTMEDLPADIQNNAAAIVRDAPNMISGEILLWLISRRGGQLSTEQLHRNICNALKQNGAKCKMPDRSTLSKRKTAALQHRATVAGTSYQTEFDNFENEHAVKPRALRQSTKSTRTANTRQKRATRSYANTNAAGNADPLSANASFPTMANQNLPIQGAPSNMQFGGFPASAFQATAQDVATNDHGNWYLGPSNGDTYPEPDFGIDTSNGPYFGYCTDMDWTAQTTATASEVPFPQESTLPANAGDGSGDRNQPLNPLTVDPTLLHSPPAPGSWEPTLPDLDPFFIDPAFDSSPDPWPFEDGDFDLQGDENPFF